MIAYLEGRVLYLGVDQTVVLVQGVGYSVYLAPAHLSSLQVDQEIGLHIYQVVREDQLALYGFSTREERELFLRVLSVSGVGPKLALAVVGSGEAGQVVHQIVSDDIDSLQRIPGIGKKTAQRMAMELKDKLADLAVTAKWIHFGATAAGNQKTADRNVTSDLLDTLISLGYGEREAQTVVRSLQEQTDEGVSLEDLVRLALRELSNI